VKSKNVFVVMLVIFLLAQTILATNIKDERKLMGAEIRVEKGALDPIEFLGTMILSSFRGVIVDFLWVHTRSDEIKENIEQLPVVYDLITSMQPTFLDSTKFAASTLAMDVSAEFHSSEEKWSWIYHALKLCEKSMKRNENHPEVWKIYNEYAWIITQKCLKNSQFTGEHGARCYELFKKTFEGRDPNEVAVEYFRKVIDFPKVPGLYVKNYQYAYEKWAHSLDDPEAQLEKMKLSKKAWVETLKKQVNMVDTYSDRVDAKVVMCENFVNWTKKPSKESKVKWRNSCVTMSEHFSADPLMVKQCIGEISSNNINFYAEIIFRLASKYDQRGNWTGLLQLTNSLDELKYLEKAVAVEACTFAISHMRAKAHDFIHGYTLSSLNNNKIEFDNNPEQKEIFENRAEKHRALGLRSYEKMLDILKENPQVFKGYLSMNTGPVSVKALENKISLLKESKP